MCVEHEEKTYLLTEPFSPTGSESCYLLMKPCVPRAHDGKDHRIWNLTGALEIISPNSLILKKRKQVRRG